MPTLVIENDTRVATASGHVLLFKANKPREVPDFLVQDCRAAGCYPAGETPPPAPPPDEDEAVISVLQEVFTEILAAGDPNLLTTDRTPRKNEVKSRTPVPFTVEQFDKAWETFPVNGN